MITLLARDFILKISTVFFFFPFPFPFPFRAVRLDETVRLEEAVLYDYWQDHCNDAGFDEQLFIDSILSGNISV